MPASERHRIESSSRVPYAIVLRTSKKRKAEVGGVGGVGDEVKKPPTRKRAKMRRELDDAGSATIAAERLRTQEAELAQLQNEVQACEEARKQAERERKKEEVKCKRLQMQKEEAAAKMRKLQAEMKSLKAKNTTMEKRLKDCATEKPAAVVTGAAPERWALAQLEEHYQCSL